MIIIYLMYINELNFSLPDLIYLLAQFILLQ